MTKTYSVYFAKVGAYVKVGHSGNVPQRLRALRRPGITHPADFDYAAPVELLRVIEGCGRDAETDWLCALHEHHAAGEWFHDSPVLRELIAQTYEPDPRDHRRWQRGRRVSAWIRANGQGAAS